MPQCKGKTAKGERCQRTTNDDSGYCHQHVDQASSRGGGGGGKAKSVANAKFDDDSLGSINDAFETMHLTRGKGDEYPICFSYKTTVTGHKQTVGTGANSKVTRTKTALQKNHGLSAHMRNGQDSIAEDLADEGFDIENKQWFVEWGSMAMQARLTVCFIDADYKQSKACMKELNFCKQKGLSYMMIRDYEDQMPTDLAAAIQAKLKYG